MFFAQGIVRISPVRLVAFTVILAWSFAAHAASLRDTLRQSVAEIIESAGAEPILELTSPAGEVFRFELQPSGVMHPDLAAAFPAIRTWAGKCLDDPAMAVRCDQSPAGLYVQIFCPEGVIYLDQPASLERAMRKSNFSTDSARSDEFRCLIEANSLASKVSADPEEVPLPPFSQLRTFRLAVTVSGEYTQFHGGTVESALAAIVTVFNRVNGIYLRELGVQLMLVPGTENLIFTNPATDPFTTSAPSVGLIQQVQDTIDQLLGSDNYDVGILLNTGTYGLAYLGSVCDPVRKGSACIGLPAPEGEQFMIYVAHELAHQFGANHTFNSNQGPCGGARHGPSAVEPGTGSTLMSYAGLPCANDSLQPLMDDYFHAESIREIRQFLQNVSCGEISYSYNLAPTISAPDTVLVPARTPFILTAEAEDPDGDTLFYTWEQMDLGAARSIDAPDNGLSPLFRSYAPSTNAHRVFPRIESLLSNAPSLGETLPQTNRTMQFRVTVRDSQNVGATVHTDTYVEVIGDAGPFRITSHNQGGYFKGQQAITWDVAGTTNAPLSVTNVNILLSTNGGQAFTITLATNVPNDGAAIVTFPAMNCSQVRLKLEPVGGSFFALNEANFTITTAPAFTRIETSGANLLLRWLVHAGKEYRLESASTLSAAVWQEFQAATTLIGGEMEAVVPLELLGARFFRVVEY